MTVTARRRQRPERPPRLSRRTAALVILCIASLTLYSTLVPIQTMFYGTPLPLSFILGAALCAAPLLSLSHPRSAIVLFCAAAFALPLIVVPELAVDAPWPWSVPALLTFILFVGVITFVHGARLGAYPLIVGMVLSLSSPVLRPELVATDASAGSATADLVVTASVAAAALLIAALIAGRLRVGVELSKEREHTALEQSRRALVEERTRIARELHDVIAHSMSLIQVQASTARYRLPEVSDKAAAEFDSMTGLSAVAATTASVSLADPGSLLWWLERPMWLASALVLTALVSVTFTPYETQRMPSPTTSARRVGTAALVGVCSVLLLLIFGTSVLTAAIAAGGLVAALRLARGSVPLLR